MPFQHYYILYRHDAFCSALLLASPYTRLLIAHTSMYCTMNLRPSSSPPLDFQGSRADPSWHPTDAGCVNLTTSSNVNDRLPVRVHAGPARQGPEPQRFEREPERPQLVLLVQLQLPWRRQLGPQRMSSRSGNSLASTSARSLPPQMLSVCY